MQGTRVDGMDELFGLEGGYCPTTLDGKRVWMVVTPGGHLGNLSKHEVTEHEDGTITVSPSILVSNPQQGELFHGFLERGVWRKV